MSIENKTAAVTRDGVRIHARRTRPAEKSRGPHNWRPGHLYSSLRAEGFTKLGSKSARYTLRRALVFGLLGGCFVTLVATAVSGIFMLCGLESLGPISTTLYWVLAIFGVSSVTIMLAVLAYEDFLEP